MIIPESFELRTSLIKNAGLGIFAKEGIPAQTNLGEYKGRWVSIDDFRKLSPKEQHEGFEYGWEIRDYRGNRTRPRGTTLKENRVIGYIDGKNPNDSNYLRYINHPVKESHENITPYQLRDKIYYVTKRDILPGEELYVNYGPEYGEILRAPSEKVK